MGKDIEEDIDLTKIDELYETFCYDTDDVAYTRFLNALRAKPENGGGYVLIENLQKYIEKYGKKIPSLYESVKKDGQEDDFIESIVYALENLAEAVNNLMDDYEKMDELRTGVKHSHNIIRANDLFNFNSYTMQAAFDKYGKELYISDKAYDKVCALIKMFKEKKSLKKVFGKNDWYNMDTKEILLSLKDFHKLDSKFFETGDGEEAEIKDLVRTYSIGFFDKIRYNCDEDFYTFDKYRPSFISKQTITPDIDKLIFCKNLLEFYGKDLYVDRNGHLDCRVDTVPDEIIADFRKLYNTKFCEKTFKSTQANVIFNPDFSYQLSIQHSKPTGIVNIKNIQTQDGLVIGMILENYTGEIYHLIHIAIKDINKNKSSYEIQLNLLPQGNINKRIQLIRIDNYETKQAHKNLGGKRLDTTTHVHLYNHFDILRGKVNGNYDISHNLENNSTDFISALHGFLSVLDLDVELHNEIVKKIKEIKSRRIKQFNETSTELSL